MTSTTVRDTIIGTITKYGSGVSFAEILRDLETAGHDTDGDHLIANEPLMERNICLWAGVSGEVFAGLADLVNGKVIEYSPTTVLVYLCDGRMIDLPLAKQLRQYKSLRWLPVVVNPGPKWSDR